MTEVKLNHRNLTLEPAIQHSNCHKACDIHTDWIVFESNSTPYDIQMERGETESIQSLEQTLFTETDGIRRGKS